MPARPPAERSLAAALAAHSSWAVTADPVARTAPARAASAGRFEREVDPDGVLDPADRARRAAHARRAHYLRMQLRSVESRRKASALLAAAEAAEAELAETGGTA
jgi:hypothetical protein